MQDVQRDGVCALMFDASQLVAVETAAAGWHDRTFDR